MADNLDARARLTVSVEGLKELVSEMDRAVQSGSGVDRVWDKLQKGLSGASTAGKAAAASVKQAGDATKAAATGWDKLDEKVRGVADAYKLAAREAAAAGRAAPNAVAFAAQRGVSESDLANYNVGRNASLFTASGIKSTTASLPSLRYALYDVATTAGVASAAITAVGVASVAAFASMESSFTNVERTLDNVSTGRVQQLRKELIGLTREIPQSFANVSEIATLGNQLGIQAGDIAKFTEVTAKFSAVTGLTAEASAQAFGSLGQLLHVSSGEYESLGSAIALVGRKSVATEQEIVAMTTRLAASATNAGFTAQEVVALSGAFASLRIAPERAQGVMEIYFNRLNTAINEGGDRLESFARVAGVAADDVRNLVRTDPVGFFKRLAVGLGNMNQQAQTGALADLGLDGIRAGEVFGRISANVQVFNDALADSNQGWAEATELGDQYAKVVDDLASRWQIFLNAVQEAGAAVGEALAPTLGAVLAFLTDVLQKFSDFSKTPFGAWVTGVLASLGAIVAGVAGLISTLALASASFLAIRFALTEFAKMAGIASAETLTLSGTMSALAGTTSVASGAMRLFRAALLATGIAGAILFVMGLITDFNGTMLGVIDAIEWVSDATGGLFVPLQNLSGIVFGLAGVLGISEEKLRAVANAMSNLDIGQVLADQAEGFGDYVSGVVGFFMDIGNNIASFLDGVIRSLSGGAMGIVQAVHHILGPAFQPIMDFLNDISKAINDVLGRFSKGFSIGSGAIDMGGIFDGMRRHFGGASDAAGGFGNVISRTMRQVKTGRDTLSDYDDALGRLPSSAGGASKAVRTLVDYANDLSSVMKRAFDFRFGNQQALDTIASGWRKIRDAASDARDAVDEHRRSLAELSADKQIKEYWLSIAENYGDELRAAKLRAELADLAADQAKEQKDLAKAQDKASMTLVGNSEAAIENRASILALVGNYQDYLKSLAASGMSQKDLQAKSAQLRAEFVQQATSMGYSRAQVEKYAKAFDDMATIINRVPRNITVAVDANTNPAMAALREFDAKARAQAGKKYSGGTISAPKVTGGSGDSKAARRALLLAEVANLSTSAAISQIPYAYRKARLEEIERKLRSGNYRSGGYTGDGGVNEIAGLVHGKEYVMSAPAVRTLGVNGMNYLHNMLKSGRVPTMGGGSGTGGMVELSPYDRQLLVDIKNAVGVTIGAQTIQATTNGYNANLAQRRSA